jgi:hypothetical protein
MTFTAVFLAFHMMLRVSEYTAKSKKTAVDHALRRKDIVFGDENGFPLGSKSYQPGRPILDRVRITIRSTKSTQAGVYYVHELRYSDSEVVQRLVEALWIWYHSPHTAYLSQDDMFFAYTSNPQIAVHRKLTARMVGEYVKNLAEDNNQPRELYSTHSLRVGGAEAMRLAGQDIETINRSGRWAPGSTAAVTYRTPAISRVGALGQVSMEPDSARDIRLESRLSSDDSNSETEESLGPGRPSRR